MEQALKQRLVGAAVIIALGIIVIPIVLDGAGERQLRKIPDAPKPRLESRPGFVQEQKIASSPTQGEAQIVLTLPPEDTAAASTKKTQSAAVTSARQATKKKTNDSVPKPAKVVPEKPKTVTKPVAKPASKQSKTASKPAAKPPADSKSKNGAIVIDKSQAAIKTTGKKATMAVWVVQVGSFTDQKKAFKLRDQLLQKRYKAFVEKVRGRSGQSLYRVRVGPLREKEKASALSVKLRQQGIKGYVTRHP